MPDPDGKSSAVQVEDLLYISGAARAIGRESPDQPYRALVFLAAAPLLPHYRPRPQRARRVDALWAGTRNFVDRFIGKGHPP